MNEIYLIDGNALIYRSFYAIPSLKTSTGIATNAIYGFTLTLLKIIKEKGPEYITVFFDLGVPTFRHETFKEYKEKRKPMPDELSGQINRIKEIVKSLGIPFVEKEGYEADDLIATYTEKFKEKGFIIYIIACDKDIYQLLDKNVYIINPVNYQIIDEKIFMEKYGFKPEKIIDFIALAGDTSDNIPGVPGIGEKTAKKLLSHFSSLEEIYNNIDKINPPSLREKLSKNKEKAYLSKKLATLERNILEEEINIDELKISTPDLQKLLEIFEMLEFKKLRDMIKEIFPEIKNIENIENMIGFNPGKIYDYSIIISNIDDFKSVFEDEKIEKIGFDFKRKIKELKNKNIEVRGNIFDLAIARHLTGRPIFADNLFNLKVEYENLLTSYDMINLFKNVEIPLIKVLIWMEENGIKVDLNYLSHLKKLFEEEIEMLKDKIYALSGEVFNLNSPLQVGEILFEKLKLPVIKKTKTGYATDTDTLKALANLHPLPQYLLSYRETYKIKSTYIEGLIEFINPKTGRIHPTYSQVSTTSGRLTCYNPNLQNLPVKTQKGGLIRKIFCAEEGNFLYSFDYSQIELRILAHFSKDPILIESFEQNKDIHSETAEFILETNTLFPNSMLLNISEEEKRRLGKIINYGIIYGITPYGLSQQLGIPVEECAFFIQKYFEKFKRVKEYIENIIKIAEEKGFVETLLKRRRYIPELKSNNKNEREFGKRVAVNMPIQGTASEIIKIAMNNIFKKFKEYNLKSFLVLQIHDELVFEVIPEEEKLIKNIVEEIMKNSIKLIVPLKVDIKKGKNFLEMEAIND